MSVISWRIGGTLANIGGELCRAPVAAEAERVAYKIASNIERHLTERAWTQIAIREVT